MLTSLFHSFWRLLGALEFPSTLLSPLKSALQKVSYFRMHRYKVAERVKKTLYLKGLTWLKANQHINKLDNIYKKGTTDV